MGETGERNNRDVDECRTKMEQLSSSLRRKKIKMKRSIGTGKVSTK
jgi:hypothetical protein